MTTTTAAIAWARRKIRARKVGQTLAIVCSDGVWVNGRIYPSFAEYAAAYGDKPRQELAIDGLTLADLAAPFL